jgi:hypothetical protein
MTFLESEKCLTKYFLESKKARLSDFGGLEAAQSPRRHDDDVYERTQAKALSHSLERCNK